MLQFGFPREDSGPPSFGSYFPAEAEEHCQLLSKLRLPGHCGRRRWPDSNNSEQLDGQNEILSRKDNILTARISRHKSAALMVLWSCVFATVAAYVSSTQGFAMPIARASAKMEMMANIWMAIFSI
jgi:hypothetical protein